MNLSEIIKGAKGALETAASLGATFGVPGASVAKKLLDGWSDAVALAHQGIADGKILVDPNSSQEELRALGDRLNAERDSLAAQVDAT